MTAHGSSYGAVAPKLLINAAPPVGGAPTPARRLRPGRSRGSPAPPKVMGNNPPDQDLCNIVSSPPQLSVLPRKKPIGPRLPMWRSRPVSLCSGLSPSRAWAFQSGPPQLGNRGLAIGGPAIPVGAEVLASSAGMYTLKGGAAGDHSRWRLTCMAVDLAW